LAKHLVQKLKKCCTWQSWYINFMQSSSSLWTK